MEPAGRHPITQIKFLSPEETSTLFRVIACDTSAHALRNKAIFSVAKYCALRASEIGMIQMTDYSIVTHCIYCKRLKGSLSNTIKIVDPVVIDYLDAYYHERLKTASHTPFLFLSQKGSPINRRTLDDMIKKYGVIANLDITKRHFHVLKHTRAMELIEYSGVELRDIQWWLGHKSIDNTMIYLAYTSKAQEKLFERIAEIEGKGKTYANKTSPGVRNFNTCST